MKVYRKYKSKYPDYGTRGNGIWVSDDVSYSEDFPGDRLVEFDFDIDNANIADAFDLSHFLVDEDGDEIDDCGDVILDNYDDEFFQRQIKNQGYDCLEYDDGYCTLYFVMNTELLSKPQIIENMNKRTPKTINIDESQLNRLILKEDDGYLSEKIKAILPLIKEEVVADGNAEHDIYGKKWKHQKDLLKDYICQNGVLMQSMENGKIYMVLRDDKLSSFLGVEYAYCVQYDDSTMKPSGTVYIRALSTFRLDIRKIQFDTRGHDNMEGTADDIG